MKFKLRKNVISYKGNMYNPGDIIEMDSFDNRLPRGWFEEVKEEPVIEKPERKKTRKKPIIKEEDTNGNIDIDSD